MSDAVPAMPRASAPDVRGAAGFVRAVARRSTWSTWAIALLAIVLLNLVREVGTTIDDPAGAPPQFRPLYNFSGLACVMLCQWLCLVPAMLAADEAVARGARRLRANAVAVVLACLAGAFMQFPFWSPPVQDFMPYSLEIVMECRLERALMMFTYQLMACSLLVFVRANVQAARQADARRHTSEIGRINAGRHALETRLKAMQARVEPQFLFNTLAHVRQLHDVDPLAAGKMLDDLIDYLRAALPHLRESSSTLGKETQLARAYLEIVRVRLGERLGFEFAVPPALAGVRIPAMMLLPLIDHALGTGAASARRDGALRIAASLAGGRVLLEIADSGAGFVPDAGGAQLGALSDRLHALYGDDASLRLERLANAGTRALLEIPHETTDRGHR